jgi:hypothetical protein
MNGRVAEGEPGVNLWISEEQKKKLEESSNAIREKSAKGELDLSKEDIFEIVVFRNMNY